VPNYKFSIQANARLSSSSLLTIKKQLSDIGKQSGVKIDLTGINKLNSAVKETTKQSQTLFQTLSKNAGKVVEWTLATGAVFGLVHAIRSSIEAAIEFDKILVDLQIVTGNTREETEKLLITYNNMAQQLGASTREVAKSANDFLRQGLSVEQTNKMITASMYLSKLGMIESAQATDFLTSATKGFKLSADEAMGVVDKLTKVDMEAAISAGYIAEAMSKTATSAQLAGVDINTLIGYIATIGEVTQKSASTVGQSMQTIFARFGNVKAGVFTSDEADMENLNDIEKVLDKVGIKIRATATTYRDLSDVLGDIAERWKTNDQVEKNAIATAVAGVRNRENFLTLMSNYDSALKLEADSLNSTGTATQKYQAYQQGLEAQTAKLTAQLEELVLKLREGEGLKFLATMATSILDVVNNMGGLMPLMTTFVGVLILIKSEQITNLFIGMGNAIKTTIGNIGAFISLAKEAGGGLQGFRAALDATKFSAQGLVSALGIITIAISAAVMIYNGYTESVRKAREAQIELGNEAMDKVQSISELSNEYNQLGSIVERTAEEEKDYLIVQNQLIDSIGIRTSELDDLTQGTDEYKAKLSELIDKEIEYQSVLAKAKLQATKQNLLDYNQKLAGVDPVNVQYDASGLINYYNFLVEQIGTLESDNPLFSAYTTDLTELEPLINSYIQSLVEVESFTLRNQIQNAKTSQEYDRLKQSIIDTVDAGENFDGYLSRLVDDMFPGIIDNLIEMEAVADDTSSQFLKLFDILKDDTTLKTIKDQLDILSDWRSSAEDQTAAIQTLATTMGMSTQDITANLDLINAYVNNDEEAFWRLFNAMYSINGISFNSSNVVSELVKIAYGADRVSQSAITATNALASMMAMGMIEPIYEQGRLAGYKNNFKAPKITPVKSGGGGGGGGGSSASSPTEKTKTYIDSLKEQISIQEDAIQSQIDLHETTINSIESQIEAQEALLDALKEQHEEEDRLLELQKEREKLANIREEKIKVYSAQAGKFLWMADPAALAEQQSVVDNLEKEYARYKEEQAINKIISALEDQKKAEEAIIDQMKAKQDQLKGFVSDIGLLDENVQKNITSWQQLIAELNRAGIAYDDIGSIMGNLINTFTGGGIGGSGGAGKGSVSGLSGTYKEGSSGDGVKAIQSALKAMGYGDPNGQVLVVDGKFGAKTAFAVRNFQSEMGITVDGIVGTNTKQKFGLKGYKDGGIVPYTGLAMLHGSAMNPEHVYSAPDVKVMSQLPKLISNLMNGNSGNGGGINIQNLTVIANNVDQLQKQLQNKLALARR
jgi:TP901 family phage tail tape measure protein